jgi:hypothetical protein
VAGKVGAAVVAPTVIDEVSVDAMAKNAKLVDAKAMGGISDDYTTASMIAANQVTIEGAMVMDMMVIDSPTRKVGSVKTDSIKPSTTEMDPDTMDILNDSQLLRQWPRIQVRGKREKQIKSRIFSSGKVYYLIL